MVRKLFLIILPLVTILAWSAPAFGQCSGLTFNAAVNIEAGVQPQNLAAGDFNGDGKTDLVFMSGSDTVSLFLGQASGLPLRVPITVPSPRAVGVGDFNKDGKLDLVVTRQPNQTFLTIFLGNGSGGFGPPTDFTATLTNPIVVADFNNDTNLDVFLGTQSFGSSRIHFGDGNGSFAAPVIANVAGNSSAVAGDFNKDGNIDLAMAVGTNSVFVSLGNGSGGFGSSTSYPVSRAQYVAAADFNSDGNIDLVSAGQSDGVSVFLGSAAGTFGAATSFSTGSSTTTVAAADFSGDGKPEVLATGGVFLSLFAGDGNGNLVARKEYILNQRPLAVALGDFNGDGAPDVGFADESAAVPPLGSTLQGLGGTILYGDGAGNLRSATTVSGISAFAIASGDLNGDGRPDLAAVSLGTNSVSVFLANAAGFNAPTNFNVGNQPRSVSLADLNGDQKLDMFTANFNANTVSVLFGDGFGGFGGTTNLSVPGFGADYATSGDFNNDGNPDLVVAYLNSTFVSVLLGNGALGFGAASNSTVPNGAQQIAVGDFNSDGRADIAVPVISGLSILKGNGNGTFAAANTILTPATATSAAVADFNGDGNADLAATVGNLNQVRIYSGDGQGNFVLSATLSTASGPAGLATADYNGDSNIDLATANNEGSTSVLLGNGAGVFAAAVTYPDGGGVTRALIADDFDLNGRVDLAFANQGGSPGSGVAPASVSVIFNACSAIPPAVPTLSISDATVTEGDAGTLNATFNVTLSAASSKTVSVSFYSANGDALRGLDYQNSLGRISFAPGTTTQAITVPVMGDVLDEFDEQFSVFLTYSLNANLSKSRGQGTILDNDPTSSISIGDTLIVEGNSGTVIATFTVMLSTASGKPITVQYATEDSTAFAGSDYVQKSNSVMLQPGTTSANITISINGDTLVEPDETFLLNLSSPVNVTFSRTQGKCIIIGDDNGSGNPIDLHGFFVRQHYRDFLNREPDVSGFEFWRNNIVSCGSDLQCIEVRRIDVSASFFLSIEFQNNGYLVERFYKAAYGNATGNSTFGGAHSLAVPVVRFNEFLQDTQRIGQGVIVLQPGWEQLLESNKQAYALEFVQTSRFTAANAFPTTMTPIEFVDKLNQNAGNVLSASERTTAINLFGGAPSSSNTTARAQAVRQVADDTDLYDAEYNRAFVLAEYYGYLRRNPNDAPESTLDYTGYDFWLTKLNQFNGNYINAEMVKAFLSSIEYRQRFGP